MKDPKQFIVALEIILKSLQLQRQEQRRSSSELEAQ